MFDAKLRGKAWGFRFSWVDAVALGVMVATSAALLFAGIPLGWMIAIVGVHFFVFCNVFRVARQRELIWAASFVLNVGFWVLLDGLDWRPVLACQIPVTLVVLAWEIRDPRYHGILADRLNPHFKSCLADEPRGQPNP